jgi:hypothetical protein
MGISIFDFKCSSNASSSAFDVDGRLFQECKCVDKILQKPITIPELINEVERLMPTKYDCLAH